MMCGSLLPDDPPAGAPAIHCLWLPATYDAPSQGAAMIFENQTDRITGTAGNLGWAVAVCRAAGAVDVRPL